MDSVITLFEISGVCIVIAVLMFAIFAILKA